MKVAEHEGIAGFRLVRCAIGEREVPGRVLRPTMSLEKRVLLGRPWLDVSPPATHPVLTGVDQVPSIGDSLLVHQVRGHELSLPKIGTARSRAEIVGKVRIVGGAASKFPLATGRLDVN